MRSRRRLDRHVEFTGVATDVDGLAERVSLAVDEQRRVRRVVVVGEFDGVRVQIPHVGGHGDGIAPFDRVGLPVKDAYAERRRQREVLLCERPVFDVHRLGAGFVAERVRRDVVRPGFFEQRVAAARVRFGRVSIVKRDGGAVMGDPLPSVTCR